MQEHTETFEKVGVVAKSCGQSLHRLAYSIAEAANVTGLGRTTLYNLINRRVLPSVKIGKRRVIRAEALDALVSGQLDEAA